MEMCIVSIRSIGMKEIINAQKEEFSTKWFIAVCMRLGEDLLRIQSIHLYNVMRVPFYLHHLHFHPADANENIGMASKRNK